MWWEHTSLKGRRRGILPTSRWPMTFYPLSGQIREEMMRNCAKWFTWAQVIWNHLRYLLALDYKSIYFHHELVSFYRLMSFPLLSWHSCTISGHFVSLICNNSRKFFLLCTFLCFWHPSFLFYLPFPLILNVAGKTAYSMWLWRWSDLDLNTNLQFTHCMTLGQWCTFLSFFFFF